MRFAVALVLVTACASSKSGTPAGDAPASTIDGTGSATTNACPDGQFASAIDRSGAVTCATLDAAAATAITDRCSVYLGWQDSCDGCTSPPTKWGSTSPAACDVGVGAGNTCTTPTLGDGPVTMMGLDLDGDMDGNDELYTTLHCIAAPRAPVPAPCQDGWAITGKAGDTWMCSPLSEAAVGYVRNSCSVYLGWQDSCNGCTTPPVKWGYANDAGCHNGTGTDDTCTTLVLGGETVNLFSVNTDGDVNDDDKFHLGLHCDASTGGPGSSTTKCPANEFVTGTSADGSFTCGDPNPLIATYFGDHCALYFGWHDVCDGCTDPPTKWGSAKLGSCANGVGADSTCGEMTLGGQTIQMFGLNPDGNVDANDTFYVGLKCL